MVVVLAGHSREAARGACRCWARNTAGVPVVIIPFAVDQPLNARPCAALGVLRAAVRDVLDDPAYRANAARLQAALAALPGVEHGVRLLERLAAEKAPFAAP